MVLNSEAASRAQPRLVNRSFIMKNTQRAREQSTVLSYSQQVEGRTGSAIAAALHANACASPPPPTAPLFRPQIRAGRSVRSAHTLSLFFLGRWGDVHLSEQVNHANAPLEIYSAARVSRADFTTAQMSGIESRAVLCVCAP